MNMNITGINAKNTMIDNMTMMKKEDVVSKNIKKQIANAHKQMQELSANKDMSVEEKVKRREELQTQINDLNMQLRQHQIEQRKEKYRKKITL